MFITHRLVVAASASALVLAAASCSTATPTAAPTAAATTPASVSPAPSPSPTPVVDAQGRAGCIAVYKAKADQGAPGVSATDPNLRVAATAATASANATLHLDGVELGRALDVYASSKSDAASLALRAAAVNLASDCGRLLTS